MGKEEKYRVGNWIEFDVSGTDINEYTTISGVIKEFYPESRQHPRGAVIVEDGDNTYILDYSGENWVRLKNLRGKK